jgi:glycosyltransferase involved in cell wall biosynthesis
VLKLPTYVLVTPARNEAQFIESTIQSVVAQTARPIKWVIVSDGSTDGTDEIVSRYAVAHEWIELLRMPERKERHFAGKAFAFSAGKTRVDDVPYEVIANLDADITFEKDYFAFLLGKLAGDPLLGVVAKPSTTSSRALTMCPALVRCFGANAMRGSVATFQSKSERSTA